MPTIEDQFAEMLAETLPKSAHKHIKAITEELSDLLDSVVTLSAVGARIPVEAVELGGCTVKLDAAGNAVSAAFDGPAEVEVMWR